MHSIRRTLMAGMISAMVVLLVSGIFLFLMVRASLIGQFDRALLDKAAVLTASVEVKSGQVIFDDEDLAMDEFHSADGPGYLQIWSDNGQTIFRSPSLGERTFSPESRGQVDVEVKPQVEGIVLPNGRSGRAFRSYYPPLVDDEDSIAPGIEGAEFGGRNVELVFARDLSPVTDTLRQLELILLVFGVGGIVVCATLLQLIIRLALKPLDALATKINAVTPDDLSTAIDLRECPEEMKPVVQRLNELLARLQVSFERERSFSADVAHELRTPLAGLRSIMEVSLSRERSAPEYTTALRESLNISQSMQDMVGNLLTLARLDSGEFKIIRENIDFGSILDTALDPLLPAFAGRGVTIQRDIEDNLAIEFDSSLLHIVLRNLLDNALSYTNTGGWTKVAIHAEGPSVVLRVSNSGCTIAPGQIENLFDRFWRADSARTDTGTHCGLGLALVKKIMTTLGGTVDAASNKDGVFEIAVAISKVAQTD